MINKETKKNISLLVIEDSEDDYELIIDKITRSGYNVNSQRIENREELKNALNNKDIDIILSDNKLPTLDALTALKLTRSLNHTIPFIIVSGTIKDGDAVQAMRCGANDYLIKDNLARLIPAIERELNEVQNKTDKIIAQQSLHQQQKEFKLLAENIHDLVCLHKPDGSYIWVSPSARKLSGYSHEELMQLDPLHLVIPEDKELVNEQIWNTYARGKRSLPVRLTYRIKRKEGSVAYMETIAEPIYDGDEINSIVTTTRDITEQKLAYDLLMESESRYQSVIESIAEGVILYDQDGEIVNINKSASKILGIPKSHIHELSELHHKLDFIQPDMTPLSPEKFPPQITINTGQRCSQILVGLRKNGDLTWLSISSEPYPQPNGQVGVVVSMSDITEQKVYEDRVSTVARELTTLIDTANAPIFGLDWDGKINEWNQVTAKLTGYSKEEVFGKKLIDEFILDGYKVAVTNLLKTAFRGNPVTNYELPIYTRTGKVVTMLFNATTRRNIKNDIVGLLGVGQDITELIEYRERLEYKVAERTKELKEALTKEKELVTLKSKFVSMASHEFRTPLSTITFATNYIHKYLEKLSEEEIKAKLKKVEEQVKHMTFLLDDVLLIGKSESGNIKLNPILITLNEFCDKLADEVQESNLNTHDILVSVVSEKDEIIVDEKLLRNIIINLLTNAIKFSPGQDKVLLDVLYKSNVLTITVRDWGLGMDQEDQDKIFEPFHRSNKVLAIQGTGLGLSIVKKAVDIQKGSIEIDSALGAGTTIKIEIPTYE